MITSKELSSIEFVGSYYQLRFEGLTLNVISKSFLVEDGKQYDDNSDKFCFIMRNCLSHIVTEVRITIGESIILIFANNIKIFISLKPEDYRAAEAVIFYSEDPKKWEVW